MNQRRSVKSSVVEPSPVDEITPLSQRHLNTRIHQQKILSDLGVIALQPGTLDTLLTTTAKLVAEGLDSEFCKVLAFEEAENSFIVRAGFGWDADVVGHARVGADLASPAGFALKTGKPVISNHLGTEQRFRTPELFARYGIVRAMNVILQGDGKPFGVLEVDSRSEGDFAEDDIPFLLGAANILGMAIERERHLRLLQEAIDRQKFLLKEMNHRIKNSLSIVSSMLHLQASGRIDADEMGMLKAAAHRVHAVARAHERLYQTDDVEWLDIGKYIEQVCLDVDESVAHCEICICAEHNIFIATDRAIPLALMVNELITNAAKHAYGGQTNGKIWVDVERADAAIRIAVKDEGVGLPEGFKLGASNGLGMRLVGAFVRQLDAEFITYEQNPGAKFVVVVPIDR